MGSPMAVEAETGHDQFWDAYSKYYDCVYRLMPYRKLLWDAYDSLQLEAGMRVLDAGCGTGNFEHFIATKDMPPVCVDAVDFSPEMLRRARAKCASLDFVSFSQADLNGKLPFDDDTFDRVVSINVLYALRDWDTTVAELIRVLKPEGRMVLTSSLPDFRVGPLLSDHVRRIGNIWGTRRRASAVWDTCKAVATTGLGSAVMNVFVIDRRESKGEYYSPDEASLTEFLGRHRSTGLETFDIGRSMADQNFLATVVKSCATAQTA